MKHIWPISKKPSWIKSTPVHEIDPRCFELFEIKGKYFMYSVSSSTFFEVDSSVFAVFDDIKRDGGTDVIASPLTIRGTKQSISSDKAKQEISELIKSGVFRKYGPPDPTPNGLSTMNLDITRDCNLNCKYCFADRQYAPGREKVMSFDTAKTALNFLVKHSSNEFQRLNVVFFGGEPLLYFPLVKQIVEYGDVLKQEHRKDIVFDIFTNGTLINGEIIQFIKDKNMRLLLSLDGPKDIHDKMRPYKSGNKSSYDAIMAQIDNIMKLDPKRLLIRSTLTNDNFSIVDTVESLIGKRFKNFVFEFAVSSDTNLISYENECSKLNEIMEKLSLAFKKYVMQGVKVNILSEPIMKVLSPSDYPPDLFSATCPAGKNFIVVSPEGNVFPCHYFADIERWKMGSIYDSKPSFYSMVNKNGIADLNKSKVCGDCWMKGHLCSGQCPYKSFEIKYKDSWFDKNHCKKQEIKYSFALKVISELYFKHNYPYISTWK